MKHLKKSSHGDIMSEIEVKIKISVASVACDWT